MFWKKIDSSQKDLVKKTAATFGISLNTVYRYITQLEQNRIIQKEKGNYKLVERYKSFCFLRSKGELVDEDKIYIKYIDQYIRDLPDNIQNIWKYAFTEMMNNAIEHSEAEKVGVSVFQNYLNTTLMLVDNGIGIFKKIRNHEGVKLIPINMEENVEKMINHVIQTDL